MKYPKSKKNYKGKKKFNKRYRKKGYKVKPTEWVNKSNPHSHIVLPKRMFSKFSTVIAGYLPNTTTASGYFSVNASSIYVPYNAVSNPMTGANGHFTLTNSYSIGALPTGYNTISTIYKYYKVHSASIRISMYPASQNDTLVYTVYPAVAEDSSVNIASSNSQPYAKYRTANAGAAMTLCSATLHHKSRDILGLSKVEYDGQPPCLLGQSPQAVSATNTSYPQGWFYDIQYQLMDNVANSAPVYCEIELIQYCELSEQIKFA